MTSTDAARPPLEGRVAHPAPPSRAVRHPKRPPMPQALALQGLVGNRAVAHVVQRSCAGGCDCCARDQESDAGDQHGGDPIVQRLLQSPLASGFVIQRKTDVETAIESDTGDAIAKLPTASLQLASDDQKIKMISIILAKGGGTERLSLLWDIKPTVIEANVDLWKTTWASHAASMAGHPLRKVFEFDTADVAKAMLTESEALLQAHLDHYGLNADSPASGQNTADRQSSLDFVQKAAEDVAGAQVQVKALLAIKIPNDRMYWAHQGATTKISEPFEPERQPPLASKEGLALWQQASTSYKDLTDGIDAYLAAVPELYPIVMGGSSSKKGAYSNPASTLSTSAGPLNQIDKSLRETMTNIKESRGLVPVLARDRKLGPVEQQLLAGTRTIDANRNWKTSPVYAAMVPTITATPGWGTTVGEMAIMAAVQIALAAATGGVGNVLFGAAQAGISATEAGVMQKASDTSMSADNALVDKREVAAANLAAALDVAFLVFDLVPGAKQARGVWGAARGDAKAAAAAAKQIEKQALELEAKLLAKAEKQEVAALEKHIKDQAAVAEKSVSDAKGKLAGATDEERRLVEIEIRRAEESLTKAKAIAGAARGGEDLTVVIGSRTYRWSPGLGLVICASPCEKAIAKLDAMAPKLLEEVQQHSKIAAQDMQGRITAARKHLAILDVDLLSGKQLKKADIERIAGHAESIFVELEAQKRFTMLRYGADKAAGAGGEMAGQAWKSSVFNEIKARKDAIEAADRRFFGPTMTPKQLDETILRARREEWNGKIAGIQANIAKEAGNAVPNGTARSTLMKDLDIALTNFEREVRGQRSLVLEGGELKALTDAEASALLGTQTQLDYVSTKNGTLMLGDSKGIGDVKKAVKQIDEALQSTFAKSFVAKGKIECRVYLSGAEFTERGFAAIGHPPVLNEKIGGKFVPMSAGGGRFPLYIVFN